MKGWHPAGQIVVNIIKEVNIESIILVWDVILHFYVQGI